MAAWNERPRRIPTRHFYDPRGSKLFEEITRLPEYYLTRAEAALLAGRAREIAALSDPTALVELGSGAATKTRLLLDALADGEGFALYVPFDVDPTMVRRTAEELTAEYPRVSVHGVVGNFLSDLELIPAGGRRLVAFLGSTIGNLQRRRAERFLHDLRRLLEERDRFLLGVDLIKDRSTLEAAYNDSRGVTAEFNRNILWVLNRRFGFDFDPPQFEHRATWNAERHRIETALVSRRDQIVRSDQLGVTTELESGEEIRTEISAKYDRRIVQALLAAGGFRLEEWMVDDEELFALALARPNAV